MQRAAAMPPLATVRGDGPWLIDEAGQRYFDVTSSWWVNLFGHADARINAALKDQLDTLLYVMLADCTHAPAVELAECLAALSDGLLGHRFLASDGASAFEIAEDGFSPLVQPRARRQARVHLSHGYHGETLCALAVTDVAVFRDACDPLLMMHAHQVASAPR